MIIKGMLDGRPFMLNTKVVQYVKLYVIDEPATWRKPATTRKSLEIRIRGRFGSLMIDDDETIDRIWSHFESKVKVF